MGVACRFCIPKFRSSMLQQTTCQWCHWWFPTTTSCFGVTNHGRLASLWLVRQDQATINSGSPPSCGAPFWQWSVASPSEMGWLASKVSRYLSTLCLWLNQPLMVMIDSWCLVMCRLSMVDHCQRMWYTSQSVCLMNMVGTSVRTSALQWNLLKLRHRLLPMLR